MIMQFKLEVNYEKAYAIANQVGLTSWIASGLGPDQGLVSHSFNLWLEMPVTLIIKKKQFIFLLYLIWYIWVCFTFTFKVYSLNVL